MKERSATIDPESVGAAPGRTPSMPIVAISPAAARLERATEFAAFAAIYVIWGSTYLAIRYAVETLPPLFMMGTRHLAAGFVLYAGMRSRGAARPEARHWLGALVAGSLLFLGGHGTLAWAEQSVPSGLAALLSATLPFWMLALGRIGRKEAKAGGPSLSGRALAGLLIGLAGVALLLGPDVLHETRHADLMGSAVVLLGTLFWAAGSIYGRTARMPASPALSAAMQMVVGGGVLLFAGLLVGEGSRLSLEAVTLRSALSLAYLIAFGSLVAFTAYIWLLSRPAGSPARVSTFAYVNPVIAVLLGWVLAGEPIGWRTLVAAAVILSGVALVTTRQPKR